MNYTVNYKEQTDETLVALTLMRDEAAFEELVLRHRRAALLMAKTATRNLHTAEDAVQDAFLCAWQRLDTLKDPAKFGPWVCRIAKYRAINLAKRYRDYIPFDEVENYLTEQAEDMTGYYDERLESDLLRDCVEKLSEKIGLVIRMFYFEGLSVKDIALKMSLAEGTVKSRLSAGRDAIRKELGYVDKNNKNETLVEAVMRRVEEFKEWRLKNNKIGFEEDYKDVLAQVEGLPDSEKKFYAMADVLKLGYWYLSDGKTDEMRAKLKEAAVKGNNKDVLALCIGFDANKYSGKKLVEYVYNVILPELEKYGISEYGAYQHYWLGYHYFEAKDLESARKEFGLALQTAGDRYPLYAALAKSTLEGLAGVGDLPVDKSKYELCATAEELIRRGDRLYFSQQPGFFRHYMDIPTYATRAHAPLYDASRVDGLVFDETMRAGDSVTDSEGKVTLTCVSTNATVTTACGDFHGCVELHTRHPKQDYLPAPVFVAWYKPSIGLVAYGWKEADGEVFGRTSLREYKISGGHGLIPLCEGNVWSYCVEGLAHDHTLRVTVTATEDNKSYLSYCYYAKGQPFDEGSWRDNILYARNNYYDDNDGAVDVSAYHDRAVALARTPWEKRVSEVSRTVMSRIYAGDTDTHPEAKQKGLWNFFQYYAVGDTDGRITVKSDRTYEFEWKCPGKGRLSMCFNFIYEILQHGLGAIWDPAWPKYADKDEEFEFHRPARWNKGEEFIGYGRITSGVTVTTTLGTFENCLTIRARTSQNESPGITYQNTDKDYFFAPGIGLVRIVTYVTSYEDLRIYDLVAYEGTGEGYMPVGEGLERHYKYVNAADVGEPDVHAGTSYYYIKDNDGKLVILGDQLGMVDVEEKKAE